jgi:hypothetical protein
VLRGAASILSVREDVRMKAELSWNGQQVGTVKTFNGDQVTLKITEVEVVYRVIRALAFDDRTAIKHGFGRMPQYPGYLEFKFASDDPPDLETVLSRLEAAGYTHEITERHTDGA